MSQRNSEYARQPRDLYETPAWVTEAIIPYLYRLKIWEPAAGNNAMVDVLRSSGLDVIGTDISRGTDFFSYDDCVIFGDGSVAGAIVSNPPFRQHQKFIEHALDLMSGCEGLVAMLLSSDFDSAKTRRHLFGDCKAFSKKIILTRRIVWFKRTDGVREAPSENHCWYVWDWRHYGHPTIAYHYE